MVVNNNYPVEIPKTYTVAYFDEVEWNKGLTFEEQKLNDVVDLSYLDEIVAKSYIPSYGPGEEWDLLKIPCPVRTCPDAINKVCKDWLHARSSCSSSYNSYMKWSTEARIKCSYCDNPSHIRNWVFKCHRHSDYSPYDGTQFTRAILIAMKAKSNISEDFGTKLLEYLEDHPY